MYASAPATSISLVSTPSATRGRAAAGSKRSASAAHTPVSPAALFTTSPPNTIGPPPTILENRAWLRWGSAGASATTTAEHQILTSVISSELRAGKAQPIVTAG